MLRDKPDSIKLAMPFIIFDVILVIVLYFIFSTYAHGQQLSYEFDEIDALSGFLTGGLDTDGTAKGYAAAHDSVAAFTSDANNSRAGQYFSANSPSYFKVYRNLVRFSSGSIVSGSVVDSAKVKFRISANDSIRYIHLIKASSTLNASEFVTADYSKFDGWVAGANRYYDTITFLADSIDASSYSVGDTLTIDLNAAGLAAISKTDTTQFYIVSQDDMNRVAPVYIGNPIVSEFAGFYDDYWKLQVWSHVDISGDGSRDIIYDIDERKIWNVGTVPIYKP